MAAAVVASGAAGVIHFAAIPEHWAIYRAAGVFFGALGAFQVVWAALVVGRPSRGLSVAGAAVAVATIGIWGISRVSGLPFGPYAGIPERAGRPDVVATVFEELQVLAIILLALAPLERWERRSLARRAYRRTLGLMAGAAAPLTVWAVAAVHGGAGHRVPAQAPSGLLAHLVGHHGLHLLFAGGAVVVYFCYLVAHIRRNGWPSFSWSLQPGEKPGSFARPA